MIYYKKVQSNGNNFLLHDNRISQLDTHTLSQYAIRDCDVKKGIGADGILVLENSDKADFRMRIFNSNGFESEMCGNGARCIALYAFDNNIVGQMMSFETLSGIIIAEVSGRRVKISLGRFQVEANDVSKQLQVSGETIHYHFLTVGVPHVVVFQEDNRPFSRTDMKAIGEAFDTNHAVFKAGTNVNFVKKLSDQTIAETPLGSGSNPEQIEVITYERGVEDITDSCGTGSCASALLAAQRYHMTTPIEALNIGGLNRVYFESKGSELEIQLEGDVFYSGDIACATLNLMQETK